MARLILLAFLFTIGCDSTETSVKTGNTEKNDTTHNDSNIVAAPAVLTGCYSWAVKRDIAKMKIYIDGNRVSGNLSYDWYEKDRNSGSLSGIVKDDLIVADYTFQSEGMISVREVVFKIKDKSLVEGFGEYDTSTDTMRFKNTGQLKFQDDRVFNKVECDSLIN